MMMVIETPVYFIHVDEKSYKGYYFVSKIVDILTRYNILVFL